MNKFIIVQGLQKLTPSSSKALSSQIGINFTDEEIKIFLPYLKENVNYLVELKNPIKKIYEDLKSETSIDSIKKLDLLLSRLGFN